MKNIIIILVLSFLVNAQNPHKVIAKFKETKILKNAQWGLYAVNLQNGKILIDENKNFALAPASGMKLITTAAAFVLLGSDYRFTTDVFINGKINKNILEGDLVIKGSGDPTFDSEYLKNINTKEYIFSSIKKGLEKSGINEINGNLIADLSIFEDLTTPGSWNWIDIGNYYGAGSTPLCFHDNLYHIYFKPAEKIDGIAEIIRTSPEMQDLKFINFMKTGKRGSGDNGYIYNFPDSYSAVLRGTIPMGYKEFDIKGSIPNPPRYFLNELKTFLVDSGIKVNGEILLSYETIENRNFNQIASFTSPKLTEILEIINKLSFNIFTDQLFKTLAYKIEGFGSFENGFKVIQDFLTNKGIDVSGLEMRDGSGLSSSNSITPKTYVELLRFMKTLSNFEEYRNSISLAGDKNDIGFFKNFGKNTIIEKKVYIKSGTIDRVKSHSGYLINSKGEYIAFSFIVNNYNGTGGEITEIHEKILVELAGM